MNKDSSEPFIKINGTTLDEAMSMTVRVAIESLACHLMDTGLGDDDSGKKICKGYINQIIKIRELMYINNRRSNE